MSENAVCVCMPQVECSLHPDAAAERAAHEGLRARVEALADQWQAGHQDSLRGYSEGDLFANDLRDALAAEVSDGVSDERR